VSAVPVVRLLFTGREVWPSRRRCGSSTSEPTCSPHSCPRTAGTHQSDQERAGERRARRPVDASAEGGERSITPRPGQPRKPVPTLLFQAGYPQWGITYSSVATVLEVFVQDWDVAGTLFCVWEPALIVPPSLALDPLPPAGLRVNPACGLILPSLQSGVDMIRGAGGASTSQIPLSLWNDRRSW
jgi:hypothetical protein